MVLNPPDRRHRRQLACQYHRLRATWTIDRRPRIALRITNDHPAMSAVARKCITGHNETLTDEFAKREQKYQGFWGTQELGTELPRRAQVPEKSGSAHHSVHRQKQRIADDQQL
jgi:hypothetical protein